MKIHEHSRILYAENNEDDCFMMSVLLKFVNIEVTCAKTVNEAWRLAQTEHFDLYLSDVQFPDGSGLELCRRLRDYAPKTPLLIYSGSAYEDDKQKGLEAGADAYLTKPYINDLAETILLAINPSTKPVVKSSNSSFFEPQMIEEAQIPSWECN